MYVIVGLGNPDKKYEHTRHNIGFDVIDALADKYNICVRAGNHCAKILDNVFNISNTVRISISFYNNKEEIDLLINVLKNSSNIWKEIL